MASFSQISLKSAWAELGTAQSQLVMSFAHFTFAISFAAIKPRKFCPRTTVTSSFHIISTKCSLKWYYCVATVTLSKGLCQRRLRCFSSQSKLMNVAVIVLYRFQYVCMCSAWPVHLLDHNEQPQVDRLVCGKWDVLFWWNHDFLTDDDYTHTQPINRTHLKTSCISTMLDYIWCHQCATSEILSWCGIFSEAFTPGKGRICKIKKYGISTLV